MRRAITVFAASAFALTGHAIAGDTIYSIDNDASSDRIGLFNSDDPGHWTPLGVATGQGGFINGLEFDGSGALYGSNGSRLFSVDLASGSCTTIGSHGLGTRALGAMAWDSSTDSMYAVDFDPTCTTPANLLSIHLGTGAASVICTLPNATCAVGLAIDAAGVGYVQDVVDDAIHTTSLADCAVTTTRSLGFDANYGQEITLNPSTGDGYIVAFNNTNFVGEFWNWNPSTGATSYVGDLGGTGLSQMAGADVDEQAVELIPFPFMTIAGSCPGRVDITVEYCTPFQNVALVYGTREEPWTVPDGVICEGTVLGIRRPKVAKIVAADADGIAHFSGQVPSNVCGNLLLQAVDLNTCNTSSVRLVPFGNDTSDHCEFKLVCILEDQNPGCSPAVWNAIKAYENKTFFGARCSGPDECSAQEGYYRVSVKYYDPMDEKTKSCLVYVRFDATEQCKPAQPVPWSWSGYTNNRTCDEDYTFE